MKYHGVTILVHHIATLVVGLFSTTLNLHSSVYQLLATMSDLTLPAQLRLLQQEIVASVSSHHGVTPLSSYLLEYYPRNMMSHENHDYAND